LAWRLASIRTFNDAALYKDLGEGLYVFRLKGGGKTAIRRKKFQSNWSLANPVKT
jgi:hypothetical protein